MSFLAPFFLLGGLAIGGPLLFHLIRRTTKEVVPFSSLMFLAPSPPRVTKRSRLEHLWLLLLRALAVLLLALGFGRPLLQRVTTSDLTGTAGRRTVVLLDTSASMRREDLWPRAVAKATETLARLRDQEGVSLITFDRAERTLISLEQWSQAAPIERVELARQQLDAVQPGWSGTGLGPALLHASEALNAAPEASRFIREIVVISDLQEGSRLEGLQGYEWPRGTEVFLEPIAPQQGGNARADWIAATDSQPAGAPEMVRLRITNEPTSKSEQFQLRWAGAPAESPATTAQVPPGQSRIVTLPALKFAPGDRLLLAGDEAAFDNETFIAPPAPEQTHILFAGGDAENDSQKSLYFLQRAFPSTRHETVEILPHPGDVPLPAWELAQAQLLVLGEGIAEPVLAGARSFASGGHIVLLPLTSPGSAQVLGALVGVPELTAEEAIVRNYAMLTEIDFQHPIFAPFADPRYSDFSKIHFWKYRRLGVEKLPGARVLARFDSHDPALVQIPLGRGSVVVLASSWRPADSQLALSTKYVPLLQALLGQSAGRPARQEQYFVGDPIPLPAGTQPWIVTTPAGTKADVAPGGSFTGTGQPGLYRVAPGSLTFAVNLPAEESRTTLLGPERLTALGVPARGAQSQPSVLSPQAAALAQRVESESRQKLWRWLLAAAVLLVLGETLLSSHLSTRHA